MTPPPENRSSARSILLVISLLCMILTSVFLSRRSLHDIQEASASIYRDRLVPTNLLVNLTATVYRKRLLLEAYVLASRKPTRSPIVASLTQLNERTDSLITEFEQTTLTGKEASQLRVLRQRLTVYNQLESELTTGLIDLPAAQQALFAGSGSTAFNQIAQALDELATLQLTVGEALLNESRGQTKYIYVLTAVQIGLVLVVGLSLFWHRF